MRYVLLVSSHALRHLVGSKVREKYGLDGAQVYLARSFRLRLPLPSAMFKGIDWAARNH